MQPGRNGLSVVTTVWGMTPGTQTPGPRHSNVGAYENMSMYQRGASAHARAQASANGYAPQPAAQPAGYYRQNSLPTGSGYDIDMCGS